MPFQIKYTKEYLKNEQRKIYKIQEAHRETIKILDEELKWIDKCREEINQANKIIREIK